MHYLRKLLEESSADPAVVEQIMEGLDDLPEEQQGGRFRRPSQQRMAFCVRAMARMDELLDFETRCKVRVECTCSKNATRAKQIAREYKGRSLEERIEAVRQTPYRGGNPVLQDDGTITCGVGTEGGHDCPCRHFRGWKYEEPVSVTWCLCCGGHFIHFYQVALGVRLRIKEVLSSALQSQRREPCRFVLEVRD
jgi:hypothetical protein